MQTLARKGRVVHENRPVYHREARARNARSIPQLVQISLLARAWKVKERQRLRRFTKDGDPMEHCDFLKTWSQVDDEFHVDPISRTHFLCFLNKLSGVKRVFSPL